MKKTLGIIIKVLNIIIICLVFDGVKAEAEMNDKYLSFNNITINDGLSQGSIEDIFQDSEGYMWFATNDGLNRYDGYDFKIIKGDIDDVNTIWPGIISSIEEDKNGDIWVGTTGGLAKINKKTFEVKRFYVDKFDESKISNHNIWDIFKDKDNNLWIGTEDGLNKYNYYDQSFEKYDFQPKLDSKKKVAISRITQDTYGKILIGTNIGLREVDDEKNLLIPYKKDLENKFLNENVAEIFSASNGRLWVATHKKGLYQFDDNLNIFIKEEISSKIYKSGRFVRAISEDDDGGLWLGTNSGLFKYSSKENNLVEYTNKIYDVRTLVNNTILDIYKDKSGLIWIGTISGISRVNPKQKFINYQKRFGEENSLSGKSTSGIYEDELGDLWIGTNASGLNRIDRKNDKYKHYKYDESNYNTISSNNIWQVTGDGKGHVWVATKGGLCKIDIRTDKITRYNHNENNKNSLVDNDVREIFIDDKGILWIGTRNGLCTFNPETEEFKNLNYILEDSGVEELFVRRIFQDSKGNYWLAIGWSSGLIKIDMQKKSSERFIHQQGKLSCLSDNLVMSVNEGLDGSIWVATSNGLNRIDTKTGQIKVYKEKDGVSNSYVYGILFDSEGNPWISTNGGISKLNIKTEVFENYTYTDGLQSNEFNVLSDFKTKSGEMLFGGVNGISSFKPEYINKKEITTMPVIISDFNVYNNEKANYSSNIKLEYDENNFTINFILPDYRDPKSIKYEYKLEGFDEQWVSADTRRDAIYTNVPSGNYKFKVRAKLKGGEKSEETTFSLYIGKPWYLSNIAIFIYLVILVVVIVVAINYVKILDGLVKQKTLELHSEILAKDKLYDEKERLYKELIRYEKFRNTYLVNLSHELRTPLNVILSSQQLISSLNKNSEGVGRKKLDEYMNIIKSNSKELLEVINDLIDSSKIKSGAYNMNFEKYDIVYIVEEVALGLKKFVENEGLELIIDPEIEEKNIECSKKEIERCITNLISNAVKFTEQGQIYITIKDLNEYVEIIVKDSGKGISKEDQSIIFDRFTQIEDGVSSKHCSSGIGLNLVKDLVELHNGTISIISEVGKGSEFIIKLPVKIINEQ
ncbi:MAG: ligand-binding sensor domain-containing protein [Sarcina sp.]